MADQKTPEEILASLGMALPQAPSPGGNYVPCKQVGGILYLSGVIPTVGGHVITGVAGEDRSIEEGYAAARACALMHLAILLWELGSLSRVAEVISVNGYVNAVAGFPDSPAVINGASDLLVQVFGEAGRHARAAIGVNALPKNALVEVQMTVRIKE
jgi:enamine deaminase RidA (YjgF/YER057c/UK114 family)